MKNVFFLVALAIAIAIGGGAYAATSMWLSTDAAGTPIAGDTITVAAGSSVQLYAFLESDAVGNVFELMVGYDGSDAVTYGAGKDTNDGVSKKLVLTSTQAAIEATMPGSFIVLKSAVLDASGREPINASLGGRPYGFVGRAATYSNAAPGKIQCFAFTLRNDMTTDGDSQYVVLSSLTGGNSYCDAWKYGTSLFESSYALNVVNSSGTPKPTYGTSGKSLMDSLVSSVAGDYNWVLWGLVTVIDANSFTIDDGSGVTVKVIATNHGRINGDYVSVKGALDLSTNPPTLTSTAVKKQN